jgi:small GTP-binding protein
MSPWLGSAAATTRLLCIKQVALRRVVLLAVGYRCRSQWNPEWKRPLSVLTTSSSATNDDRRKSKANSSYQQDDDEGVLRLLTNEQRALLQEQRALTHRAAQVAEDLQLPSSYSSSSIVQQLESSMFSIVVAGEFNGGKSTFLNALLGKPLLEMGPLPTTDSITIVTGAGSGSRTSSDTQSSNSSTTTTEVEQHSGIVIHRVGNTSDVNFLSDDLILVDTPGSNSLSDGHEFRTKRWLPHADLILFVISADRPMSESERSFLKSMERYRKQIILIINKIDLLESLGDNYGQAAKQHVVDFVTENASSLLGRRPLVFPVSARNALECKVSSSFIVKNNTSSRRTSAIYSESPIWKRSGLETLQSFLIEELTNEAKVKTKLCNPIRVAESIARDALEALVVRRKALDSDKATLSLLEEQMNAWEVLMERDMRNDWDAVNRLLLNDSNKLHDSLQNKRISFITQLMLFLSRKRFSKHCEDFISNKTDIITKIDAIVKESS